MRWLGTVQGYRRDTLDVLAEHHVRAYLALSSSGALTLCAATAAGFSAFTGMRQAGMSVAPALGVGLGASWFMLNLHRLINAGSGLALGLTPEAQARWRPSAVPILVFAALGAVLSQLALLALLGGLGEAAVAAERQRLSAEHAAANLTPVHTDKRATKAELDGVLARRAQVPAYESTSGSEPDAYLSALAAEQHTLERQLAELDGLLGQKHREQRVYEQHLASMHFPLSRLMAIWQHKPAAAALTLLFVLLLCAPSIARVALARAVRRYEQERAAVDTSTVRLQFQRAQVRCAALVEQAIQPLELLHKHARKRTAPQLRSPYMDAPFNREPVNTPFQRAQKISPGDLLLRASQGSSSRT